MRTSLNPYYVTYHINSHSYSHIKCNFETHTFHVFIHIINKNDEQGRASNRVLQQITREHTPGWHLLISKLAIILNKKMLSLISSEEAHGGGENFVSFFGGLLFFSGCLFIYNKKLEKNLDTLF